MSLAHAVNATLSPEEYLVQEQDEPVKHEYLDGVIYAMAGAGELHNRVAMNAAFHFRAATRGKPCGAYMADMKLRILTDNLFYYPDVMLACDPDDDRPLYGDGGFLQLSKSLRLRYCAAADCAQPVRPGGRVTAVSIAGQPLDLERTYRIATNDYLAGGGNGYVALGQACKRAGGYCRETGIVLLDLLVARLKNGEPLTTVTDGRITRLNQ